MSLAGRPPNMCQRPTVLRPPLCRHAAAVELSTCSRFGGIPLYAGGGHAPWFSLSAADGMRTKVGGGGGRANGAGDRRQRRPSSGTMERGRGGEAAAAGRLSPLAGRRSPGPAATGRDSFSKERHGCCPLKLVTDCSQRRTRVLQDAVQTTSQ